MVRLRVLIFFSYVFFTLSIIITYTLSLQRERARLLVVPALLSGDHGASPPLPEIRLKQDEYWGGVTEKMVSADRLGQCASYRTIETTTAR